MANGVAQSPEPQTSQASVRASPQAGSWTDGHQPPKWPARSISPLISVPLANASFLLSPPFPSPRGEVQPRPPVLMGPHLPAAPRMVLALRPRGVGGSVSPEPRTFPRRPVHPAGRLRVLLSRDASASAERRGRLFPSTLPPGCAPSRSRPGPVLEPRPSPHWLPAPRPVPSASPALGAHDRKRLKCYCQSCSSRTFY